MIFSIFRPPAPSLKPHLLLLFFFLTFFNPVDSHADRQVSSHQGTVFHSETELWQAAEQALASGDRERAAVLYGRFQQRYWQSARAEKALWQAARLHHELALGRKEADWEQVRDLYRLFVAEHPESEHFQEAYLGLALAHFRMHFYREALIYLNLFLEKFPRSSLRSEALYWQGRTLETIGRLAEAEKNYQELAANADSRIRIMALEALSDLYFAVGRFHEALASYQTLLKEFVPHTLEYMEVIRRIGLANGRLGHEAASRDHLYRYLNVVENSPRAAEVFFELAESYWRLRQLETANSLYAMVLERGEPQARAVVLSRFRQAYYRDLQEKDLSPWLKKQDDMSAAGDQPYEAVLDTFGREPIAQDARRALLQRLLIREEFEQAFLLAKAYLNHLEATAAHQQEVEAILGQLLVRRVEKLLAGEEHRQVVELYQHENRHMEAYDQGRLFYLVGMAMEALGLHDQAAVIYSRTLARELTPSEKFDLSQRRARVYLIQKDEVAAERLLAFLRDIYQEPPETAEILYLSGRLRQMQGRSEEAAGFYAEGCRLAAADFASPACQARVQAVLHLGRVEEAAEIMTEYREMERLTPATMQDLYGELGDIWRRQGDLKRAAAAYASGVGDKMPSAGERARSIHLRLGDVSLALGWFKQAKEHYEQVRSGPDDLLGKSAEKGLGQVRIEQGMAELHQALNRTDAGNTP
jgi:tetratricopeptide (TPR) repeat protein